MEKSFYRDPCWWCVTVLALVASWPYFFGTPFIFGLDYFTHVASAYMIQQGIVAGDMTPAYSFLFGGGKSFVRYQAYFVSQIMGWMAFVMQVIFAISDGTAFVIAARITAICIQLFSAWGMYLLASHLVGRGGAALIGVAVYIFIWPRWGTLLHVGAFQRAGALAAFPYCLYFFYCWHKALLTNRQKALWAISLSVCLLCHPGNFIFLGLIMVGLALISYLFGNFSLPKEKKYYSDLCLIFSCFLAITAWFWLPLVMEKEHYGQYRTQQQSEVETAPTALSAYAASEFVNRNIWFYNLSTDSNAGGSQIANYTGVNSSYLGWSIVLLIILAIWKNRQTSQDIRREFFAISALVLIFLSFIFLPNLRSTLFHPFGMHMKLSSRWLEPLSLLIAIQVTWSVFILQKTLTAFISHKHKTTAIIVTIIVVDFCSLVFFSPARHYYLPKQGSANALQFPLSGNCFPAYKFLEENNQRGTLLELPTNLLAHGNVIYHKNHVIPAEEPTTVWSEARLFDEKLIHDLEKVIEISLDYIPDDYDKVNQKNISHGPEFQESNLIYRLPSSWQGQNHWQIELPSLPEGVVFIPLTIPAQTSIQISKGSQLIQKLSPKPNSYNLLFATGTTKKPTTLRLDIDKQGKESLVIGEFHPIQVFYKSKSLAYRLALLDVRFLAINLPAYGLPEREIRAGNTWQKVYSTKTCVLLETKLFSWQFFQTKFYL